METLFTGMYTPVKRTTLADVFAASDTASDRIKQTSAGVNPFLRTGRNKKFASKGVVLANLCVDTHNPKSTKGFSAEADASEGTHYGRYRTWQDISCSVIGHRS